ncbi:sulfatase [Niabella terrae]
MMLKQALLLTGLFLNLIAAAQGPPNIIVFLVDDMGWMDSSVPFGKEKEGLNLRFQTPNMERLARQGMKFTNAYAAPVCTPSRVSLMSGMNAAHHGVTNWTSVLKNIPSDYENKNSTLLRPDWNINGMSPVAGVEHTVHATPVSQLLKDAGYFTIHVGKAHWAAAGTPGASPYNMGFLVNIAGNVAGMPQSYWGTEHYGNQPGKSNYYAVQNMTEYYGTDTFLTEALTLEALKALDYPIRHRQPFFLYLAHYAVHLPVYADQRFFNKYLAAGLDSGQAKYASMIEGMDKSLGDIMDYLKEMKVDTNTVILFMSDNGSNSISPAKGDQPHTANAPLREGKASVYEGGIREPMLVKWPGVIKAGTVNDQPVIIEDFFPSLLEIAGVKDAKPVQEVDGRSFVPILKGQPDVYPHRQFIWHYPNKWKKKDLSDIDYLAAIRQDKWKLVYRMLTGELELYELSTDISEKNNLAGRYPEKVKALAGALGQQLRQWQAPMPIRRNTGKSVALPDAL